MKLCSNKCGPLYFHTSLFGLCLLLFQGFLEHQLAQEDPGKKKLIMIKNPFFTITTDINRKKKKTYNFAVLSRIALKQDPQ